ncbi:hypothetical protein CPC08DRAFT_765678 [Agrocybe pediades]|nr:hypothetical protein CPC08DRAFT_765678 [Agrocybe pediades]
MRQKQTGLAKEDEEEKDAVAKDVQMPEVSVPWTVEESPSPTSPLQPTPAPARATVAPRPVPKDKQRLPPPPQLLSQINTNPSLNAFGVNAVIRRPSRTDGEIELEGKVRPSPPVQPSHTPITPHSQFNPPSKFSAPSLSPTPQAVNPIPLARRLHPPANNNAPGRPN